MHGTAGCYGGFAPRPSHTTACRTFRQLQCVASANRQMPLVIHPQAIGNKHMRYSIPFPPAQQLVRFARARFYFPGSSCTAASSPNGYDHSPQFLHAFPADRGKREDRYPHSFILLEGIRKHRKLILPAGIFSAYPPSLRPAGTETPTASKPDHLPIVFGRGMRISRSCTSRRIWRAEPNTLPPVPPIVFFRYGKPWHSRSRANPPAGQHPHDKN